jgi:hypothetical protein
MLRHYKENLKCQIVWQLRLTTPLRLDASQELATPQRNLTTRRIAMKRSMFAFAIALICVSAVIVPAGAQGPNTEVKFIADTLVVQAEGSYESDPDVATLTFLISAQDKELKQTYDRASESMRRIAALAEKNGLQKADVSSGVLTVRPYYEGDKRKKAKSYAVQGQMILRVRDFSKLGPIMEGSVDDGITDFRSLTYTLADEEAAKERAVSEAMRRAVGRASAALEPKGQKVGVLRFANLDVKQLVNLANMSVHPISAYVATETVEVSGGGGWPGRAKKAAPVAPPSLPQPEKITVSASVQCAFQIL